MALRSQHFVVDRELQLEEHRDKIKPDIIWNTELGLKQTTSQLAWAERERAALYRRMVEFFADLRSAGDAGRADRRPSTSTCARPRPSTARSSSNYMAGSTLNSAITVTGSPAIAVPCGFDPYGRPVGLQLVGKPRGEAALLQAASLYERLRRPRQAPAHRPQAGQPAPSVHIEHVLLDRVALPAAHGGKLQGRAALESCAPQANRVPSACSAGKAPDVAEGPWATPILRPMTSVADHRRHSRRFAQGGTEKM